MGERHRILVVDDDIDACEAISLALQHAGYAVETAASGPDALAIVAVRRPDLLLTDLVMPNMDGVELIRRVRALDAQSPGARQLPVVLATGVETGNMCTAAPAYGAVACVAKPINLDDLLWIIDSTLACEAA
jgi:CheY-like chemotaxis protein